MVGLRFIPSAVKGLPEVSEVDIYPDRLELMSAGQLRVFRFIDIANWGRFGWFYRGIAQIGWGVFRNPCVGIRDWFHPPSLRFFCFYTQPRLQIFLPDEAIDLPYNEILFVKIKEIISSGGFSTSDMG